LVLQPITITSDSEKCLIESSINSVRVSILFKFQEADQLEKLQGQSFLNYLTKRAEDFLIVRRLPVEGFSFSFLITNKHVDDLTKNKILGFILHFMVEVDKEISSLKISQNARGRAIASEYMKLFG